MNSCYTCLLFAFLLVLAHSATAYRALSFPYPYSYEALQQAGPSAAVLVVAPHEGDYTWPQYSMPSMGQLPDDRIRRGWGNGRRRRSATGGH